MVRIILTFPPSQHLRSLHQRLKQQCGAQPSGASRVCIHTYSVPSPKRRAHSKTLRAESDSVLRQELHIIHHSVGVLLSCRARSPATLALPLWTPRLTSWYQSWHLHEVGRVLDSLGKGQCHLCFCSWPTGMSCCETKHHRAWHYCSLNLLKCPEDTSR
jgi:hypothetical protein